MRPTDSSYDRNAAAGTTALLTALRAGGHDVQTPVTGSVIVDGDEIVPAAWDRMAMEWDGTADGLEDMGWERASDVMREEEEETITRDGVTHPRHPRCVCGSCWSVAEPSCRVVDGKVADE